MKKIIHITIATLFLLNSISHGLSPEMGFTVPGTRDAMYAGAQKLWREKSGPGGTWVDRVFGKLRIRRFIGKQIFLENIKFRENPTHEYLPYSWEKNPILQKRDLIDALRCFRDDEARIPSEFLEIDEGYYELEKEKDGELPLVRIEEYYGGGMLLRYKLIVHTKLVQMWNHIRANDVWFDYQFEDGKSRTISLAWGIFYRIAKHEMADLTKEDRKSKGGGHIKWYPSPSEGKNKCFGFEKNETTTNQIGGRYNMINDTIWLWFLQSYCFYDSTRYNNEMFNKRLSFLLSNSIRQGNAIREEFPNLQKELEWEMGDSTMIGASFPRKLALAINYHFFSRKGIKVPELRDYYKESYEIRKPFIIDTRYAGGTDERSSEKATATKDILTEVSRKYDISVNDEIMKLFEEYLNELTWEKLEKVKDESGKLLLQFIEVLLSQQDAEFSESVVKGLRLKNKNWNIRWLGSEKMKPYYDEQNKNDEKQTAIVFNEERLKHLAEKIHNITPPVIEVVSDNTAPLLKDQGPGVMKPMDEATMTRVWQGRNALYENKIEIFFPQSTKLTGDIEKKLVETKKAMEKTGNILSWDRYKASGDDSLFERLKNNENNVKRIVLTDELSAPLISTLIENDDNTAELFRNVKLLNFKNPGELNEQEQTQYQTHLLMTAILARLLEEGDGYFNDIRILLADLLANCFDAEKVDINTFINTLAAKEDKSTSLEKVRQRIRYFLLDTPAISLIEKLQVDWEKTKEFFHYL